MKILNHKNRRNFPEVWLLVAVIVSFVLLFSPFRNIGIVLISLTAIYVAISSYSKFSNTNDNRFRSRARDQDFKDQERISQ
ncbi:MAG TPA: hypothetical protein DCR40_12105 [Prolixibacteraceae bacterium]|nr:hypothetical protein [Prolixibacteraceae bacterium]